MFPHCPLLILCPPHVPQDIHPHHPHHKFIHRKQCRVGELHGSVGPRGRLQGVDSWLWETKGEVDVIRGG